jgi:hypothetical protein
MYRNSPQVNSLLPPYLPQYWFSQLKLKYNNGILNTCKKIYN